MGKASSAKKVARAARAGGSRRPGQRRPVGFPLLVFAVCAIGVSLILFARSTRESNASPLANEEHWHAAFGINHCGEWQFDSEGTRLVDVGTDALGIHTHGDGVIHIHPFLNSAAGRNARLQVFLDQVDVAVTDSKITWQDGSTWDESTGTCTVDGEDVPGQIVLAKWNDAQEAADGEKPNVVFTEDFGDVRFQHDREYYTFAFVPEGELEDLPVRPDLIADLNNLSDVVQAPDNSTSTSTAEQQSSTSTSTATDESTTTTAAAEE